MTWKEKLKATGNKIWFFWLQLNNKRNVVTVESDPFPLVISVYFFAIVVHMLKYISTILVGIKLIDWSVPAESEGWFVRARKQMVTEGIINTNLPWAMKHSFGSLTEYLFDFFHILWKWLFPEMDKRKIQNSLIAALSLY